MALADVERAQLARGVAPGVGSTVEYIQAFAARQRRLRITELRALAAQSGPRDPRGRQPERTGWAPLDLENRRLNASKDAAPAYFPCRECHAAIRGTVYLPGFRHICEVCFAKHALRCDECGHQCRDDDEPTSYVSLDNSFKCPPCLERLNARRAEVRARLLAERPELKTRPQLLAELVVREVAPEVNQVGRVVAFV